MVQAQHRQGTNSRLARSLLNLHILLRSKQHQILALVIGDNLAAGHSFRS
jgi:hypothetical protein